MIEDIFATIEEDAWLAITQNPGNCSPGPRQKMEMKARVQGTATLDYSNAT